MKRKKGGTCYEDHFRWVLKIPKELEDDVRLVHGTVWSIPWNKRIDHCWIELGGGDVVVDLTTNFAGRAKKYYAMGKAEVNRKYTKKEAMRMALKTKTFGHWEAEYDNEG